MMSELQHDASGFLIGDPINLLDDASDDSAALLRAIGGDIGDISESVDDIACMMGLLVRGARPERASEPAPRASPATHGIDATAAGTPAAHRLPDAQSSTPFTSLGATGLSDSETSRKPAPQLGTPPQRNATSPRDAIGRFIRVQVDPVTVDVRGRSESEKSTGRPGESGGNFTAHPLLGGMRGGTPPRQTAVEPRARDSAGRFMPRADTAPAVAVERIERTSTSEKHSIGSVVAAAGPQGHRGPAGRSSAPAVSPARRQPARDAIGQFVFERRAVEADPIGAAAAPARARQAGDAVVPGAPGTAVPTTSARSSDRRPDGLFVGVACEPDGRRGDANARATDSRGDGSRVANLGPSSQGGVTTSGGRPDSAVIVSTDSAARDAADAAMTVAGSVATQAEKMDPVVASAKEVADLAAPVVKAGSRFASWAFGKMTGGRASKGESKDTRILTRIWRVLTRREKPMPAPRQHPAVVANASTATPATAPAGAAVASPAASVDASAAAPQATRGTADLSPVPSAIPGAPAGSMPTPQAGEVRGATPAVDVGAAVHLPVRAAVDMPGAQVTIPGAPAGMPTSAQGAAAGDAPSATAAEPGTHPITAAVTPGRAGAAGTIGAARASAAAEPIRADSPGDAVAARGTATNVAPERLAVQAPSAGVSVVRATTAVDTGVAAQHPARVSADRPGAASAIAAAEPGTPLRGFVHPGSSGAAGRAVAAPGSPAVTATPQPPTVSTSQPVASTPVPGSPAGVVAAQPAAQPAGRMPFVSLLHPERTREQPGPEPRREPLVFGRILRVLTGLRSDEAKAPKPGFFHRMAAKIGGIGAAGVAGAAGAGGFGAGGVAGAPGRPGLLKQIAARIFPGVAPAAAVQPGGAVTGGSGGAGGPTGVAGASAGTPSLVQRIAAGLGFGFGLGGTKATTTAAGGAATSTATGIGGAAGSSGTPGVPGVPGAVGTTAVPARAAQTESGDGRKRLREPLVFGRMLRALTGLRNDAAKANALAARRLKEIADKPVGGGKSGEGGGLLSMLGNLLPMLLPLIGVLLPMLLPLLNNVVNSVVDGASKALEAAKAAATKAVDAIVGGASNALEAAKATTGKAVDAVVSGAGSALEGAKNWVLGQTSKWFESGRGGAGTVSSGKGDAGGASYGTYQLSSKAGTLQEFIKSKGYSKQFDGLTPGTEAFNARWKEVAKSDPNFGQAQHDYIKATHYDPAMAGLKRSGIDLSDRGSAARDAVWSTSVQFGAGSVGGGKGAVPMFSQALAGKDVSKLTDAQIVSAIQDYKIANNDRLFASSSEKVREGTASRAIKEKERLLAQAGKDAAVVATSGAAGAAGAAGLPGAAAAPGSPGAAAIPALAAAGTVAAAPAVASGATDGKDGAIRQFFERIGLAGVATTTGAAAAGKPGAGGAGGVPGAPGMGVAVANAAPGAAVPAVVPLPVAPGGSAAKPGTLASVSLDSIAKSGGAVAAYLPITMAATPAVSMSLSIPRAPEIPSSVPPKLPDAVPAAVPPPPLNEQRQRPIEAVIRVPVTQNVPDRSIAHVVTGGLGGTAL